MNISEANDWLNTCAKIFDGEGGYIPLPDGGYEFDPAPLRAPVPTSRLVSLLATADRINADEDYRHMLTEHDNYQSLLAHINRRAVSGDALASAVLEQRMAHLFAEDWSSTATISQQNGDNAIH